MRKFKRTVNVIFATLLTAVACFVGFNWKEVKTVFTNKTVYTQSQLEEQYNEGYNAGRVDGKTYITQLDYYKSVIADNEKQIQDLTNTITSLNANNSQYEQQLTELAEQRDDLQAQVDVLTAENSQLQGDNKGNLQTIADLNAQINALNKQISDMTDDYQSAISQVELLNKQIADMQASIDYYEQFVANLGTNEQVVATFEYDGTVYEVQTVTKGSTLTITNPTNTEYKIFNGWKVGDEIIDLATYTITENTKFVADITYKYDVKFMVDDAEYNSQIVTTNGCATIPTDPTKDGYEFDGWSINGVDVVSGIGSTPVTSTTTYIAVFTKLHTVTFMYDGSAVSTQSVRNGEYATVPTIEDTENKTFNGWLLNGESVAPAVYQITGNITFVADVIYNDWNAVTMTTTSPYLDGNYIWSDGINTFFLWDDEQYVLDKSTSVWNRISWNIGKLDIHYIWTDGENIYYAGGYVLNKSTFTWDAKTWNGFTSIVGKYVWTDGTNTYYSKGTQQYILDKSTSTWDVKQWNGLTDFSGDEIWSDKNNGVYCEFEYVLDKSTSTWTEKTWNNYTPSDVREIWTDGTDTYYSNSLDNYVLNPYTSTWDSKTWTGLTRFSGQYIWTDGEYTYYSKVGNAGYRNYFILDKSVSAWTEKTWNGPMANTFTRSIWSDGINIYFSSGGESFVWNANNEAWDAKSWNLSISGRNIWTDGENFYYSQYDHYVLDKVTLEWNKKAWGYIPFTTYDFNFDGGYVWTDGNETYYSRGTSQYVLDKSASTWTEKTWNGLNEFYGNFIWTDGTHTYYSNGTSQYVLDKSTSTWEVKEWTGLTGFYGTSIWTDGTNIYYSADTEHYILDKTSSTWNVKEWNGLTKFNGSNIWTDGTNTYYSDGTQHYKLCA